MDTQLFYEALRELTSLGIFIASSAVLLVSMAWYCNRKSK
jgi:hypothetical protein